MKVHKKANRVILIFISVLLAFWCIMFVTDYRKCSDLQKPIFVVPLETVDAGRSIIYQGLGYTVKLEVEYTVNEPTPQIISVTMKMFDQVVAASIT